MASALAIAQGLIRRQTMVHFAQRVADLCEKHRVYEVKVSVQRHRFCNCLNVVGRLAIHGNDVEAFAPIDIPHDWSEAVRRKLESSFQLMAEIGADIAQERCTAGRRIVNVGVTVRRRRA